jgi:hypothetical protein
LDSASCPVLPVFLWQFTGQLMLLRANFNINALKLKKNSDGKEQRLGEVC